jgi:hypothetical protein
MFRARREGDTTTESEEQAIAVLDATTHAPPGPDQSRLQKPIGAPPADLNSSNAEAIADEGAIEGCHHTLRTRRSFADEVALRWWRKVEVRVGVGSISHVA